MDTGNKKPWTTPELMQYGSVEELTQGPKWKQLGTSDDFAVPGISDA